ncbi:mobilization protein, partial [Streptomyces sp. NPDC057654]
SRSHARAERGHDWALRKAARDLVHGGPALGRGEDGASTAMAIDMLFFLITAAVHWHARRGHAQQAAAARQAAEHLRAAYRSARAQPLGVLYQRGRHLNRALLHRQTAMVREALPDLAEQVLAEPGWYALAASLADAEAAGHDPAALLSDATQRRELHTAESVSDVLVWRLRRLADLPADASGLPAHGTVEGPSAGRHLGPTRPAGRRERPQWPGAAVR